MEYSTAKNHFEIVRCIVGGRKLTTILCNNSICAEFEQPLKGVAFKQGLFVYPSKKNEGYNNRTYYFFNNNGEQLFAIKRKMNEDKTEFVENISIYEDDESVSYIRASFNGDIVSRTFNVVKNSEIIEGQTTFL